MAQISSRLITPKLNPPQLSNSRLEPVNPEDVNKPLPALTPPTIVSIKRHDSADVFDRLPRDERVAAVSNLIGRANELHGTDLPVPLGLAVVSTESSFRAKSISRDGHATKGLFQFLDSTGREILSRSDSSSDYSPLNPEQNVSLGVRYLTHLQDIFSRPTKLANGVETIPATTTLSNKKIALAAFNAGEGRLASAQARALREQLNPGDYDDVKLFIPASTRRYVESVLKQEQEFQLATSSREE
jgi:soluble lytic murein transglycosylase-like protein